MLSEKDLSSSGKVCKAVPHIYSLHPIFFVLFEKLNFLREPHLLSCLPFKNV